MKFSMVWMTVVVVGVATANLADAKPDAAVVAAKAKQSKFNDQGSVTFEPTADVVVKLTPVATRKKGTAKDLEKGIIIGTMKITTKGKPETVHLFLAKEDGVWKVFVEGGGKLLGEIGDVKVSEQPSSGSTPTVRIDKREGEAVPKLVSWYQATYQNVFSISGPTQSTSTNISYCAYCLQVIRTYN